MARSTASSRVAREFLRTEIAKAFIIDHGGSQAFGSPAVKAQPPLSKEARQHLESLLDNDDPAIRHWAESLLETDAAPAAKRASDHTPGLRAYVARIAANDPNPAVRARADAVLDRLHTEATT